MRVSVDRAAYLLAPMVTGLFAEDFGFSAVAPDHRSGAVVSLEGSAFLDSRQVSCQVR